MRSPPICASIRCSFDCATSANNKRGTDALIAAAKQASWQERPSPDGSIERIEGHGARRRDLQPRQHDLRRRSGSGNRQNHGECDGQTLHSFP